MFFKIQFTLLLIILSDRQVVEAEAAHTVITLL